MCKIFLSDTHLTTERPESIKFFFDFLRSHKEDLESLYILGDLFEVWLGDDAITEEQQKILDLLLDFSRAGTEIHILHGNRDFLYGNTFEMKTGAKLIAENTLIDLYGKSVLLAHGDALCTDDIEYQKVRAMARSPQWQQQTLALSVAKRKELAGQYRAMSKSQTGLNASEIMDVNSDAVSETMKKYQADYLIHGHTHRPAIHRLQVRDKTCYRIVLGDWISNPSALICTPEKWTLQDSRVTQNNTLEFSRDATSYVKNG